MSASLQDYRDVVGAEVIDELLMLADRVKHRRLQHINSTAVGGGVAELLTRLVPLFRNLGIDTTWDVIKGDQAFFEVTKTFHNALHGEDEAITEEMFAVYRETMNMNLYDLGRAGDLVVVHDPQPAGLIARKEETGGHWLWRCHIDVSTPHPEVWGFLKRYVDDYDASMFSMPEFSQKLSIPQFLVPPSIDPLSDKNRELPDTEIRRVLEKYGLDPDSRDHHPDLPLRSSQGSVGRHRVVSTRAPASRLPADPGGRRRQRRSRGGRGTARGPCCG